MILTIDEVINKVNKTDATIRWLDEEWSRCGDEHKEDMLEDASDLLKEYRSLILKTEIDL